VNIFIPSSVDLSDPSAVQPELPVMVWIHGGAYQFGSANYRLYDSRWLANRADAIVVAINYRIGKSF